MLVSTETPELTKPAARSRLSCLRSDAGDATRLTLVGELDATTVPRLSRALGRAQRGASVVALDLLELDAIDSSGMHLLLKAGRRMRDAGGRLVVVRASAEVEWLLTLLGIDRRMMLVDRSERVLELDVP